MTTTATPASAWHWLRGSGLDTSNGLEFVQRRIARFAKIITLISAAFFVLGAVGRMVLGLRYDPGRPLIEHVAGMVLVIGVWLLCRGLRRVLAPHQPAGLRVGHVDGDAVRPCADTRAAPHTRSGQAIPPDLEQPVMDCLEKDPARRPAGADVLARRLSACQVPEPWTPERAEHWWRAHGPSTALDRPVADVLLSHERTPARSGRSGPDAGGRSRLRRRRYPSVVRECTL